MKSPSIKFQSQQSWDIPRRLSSSRYAARLKAAALAVHEPLNGWLSNNLDATGWVINWVYPKLDPLDDPNTFHLWMEVELPCTSGVHPAYQTSPTILLARYIGFKDDGDAPGWIRDGIQPGERSRFILPREFLAALFCGKIPELWAGLAGKLEDKISSSMLTWASAAAVGTDEEASILEHCKRWRATHRVRCHAITQRKLSELSFHLDTIPRSPIYGHRPTSPARLYGRIHYLLLQLFRLEMQVPTSLLTPFVDYSIAEELLARELFLAAATASDPNHVVRMNDLQRDAVRCTVGIEIDLMPKPNFRAIYTLTVIAAVSRDLDLSFEERRSPIAIVDQFISTHDHADAPGWVGWVGSRNFTMSCAGFIGLFTSMAMWPENLGKPNLSISMIAWCGRVSVRHIFLMLIVPLSYLS
ncbi:hypothetical protein C8R43DRAFT_1231605 [Mycena crocata]|nr:hypothetical protein C8R43DRAFT_1231605 [Mycena crocata]